MTKKWAISDEPPRKVRLVQEREGDKTNERLRDKPIRVKAIGRRIVKVLLALWMLSVGAWLQAYHHGSSMASNDQAHDSIDGHEDPFGLI